MNDIYKLPLKYMYPHLLATQKTSRNKSISSLDDLQKKFNLDTMDSYGIKFEQVQALDLLASGS